MPYDWTCTILRSIFDAKESTFDTKIESEAQVVQLIQNFQGLQMCVSNSDFEALCQKRSGSGFAVL